MNATPRFAGSRILPVVSVGRIESASIGWGCIVSAIDRVSREIAPSRRTTSTPPPWVLRQGRIHRLLAAPTAHGFNRLGIWRVADIRPADLQVFAVEASRRRLVGELMPVDAHYLRVRKSRAHIRRKLLRAFESLAQTLPKSCPDFGEAWESKRHYARSPKCGASISVILRLAGVGEGSHSRPPQASLYTYYNMWHKSSSPASKFCQSSSDLV